MLSLIICSRATYIPQNLKDNISKTIGVDYELVVIDNSKNLYSIFSAYNEGVRRARYPYLCFMHEDILYHSQDWGKKVIKHFEEDPETGLIGVFGGHYLPDLPAHIGDSELLSGKLYASQKGSKSLLYDYNEYFDGKNNVEVVAVDGMWFVIPNLLFKKICFDENFPGFHYYDIDISLQVISIGYKCKVVNDIIMEHNTNTNIDKIFINSTYDFYKKWKHLLPIEKGHKFDNAHLKTVDLLCQFKEYSRELNFENNRIKTSKAFYLVKILLSPYYIFKKYLVKLWT